VAADIPDDVQSLRDQFPGWTFGTVWVSAASGPDARRIWATKDGVPAVGVDGRRTRRRDQTGDRRPLMRAWCNAATRSLAPPPCSLHWADQASNGVCRGQPTTGGGIAMKLTTINRCGTNRPMDACPLSTQGSGS
jgi:hypothetical protein